MVVRLMKSFSPVRDSSRRPGQAINPTVRGTLGCVVSRP